MSDSTRSEQVQRRRWPKRRWIILGSAGIIAIVVVLAFVFLRSTKPSSVTAGELDSALLDGEQINTIMGTENMQISKPNLAPAKPTIALSKPDCLGTLIAAQAPTYVKSGYTAFRSTEARTPGKHVDHYVAQAASIFPDADKANAFVKHSADQWKSCAKATVVVMAMRADKKVDKKSEAVWSIETPTGDSPSITILESRRKIGLTCQRAMRAVSNAVIDATACGYNNVTNQGSSVADRIAANISK
jgi:serine/threonine kinase PknH